MSEPDVTGKPARIYGTEPDAELLSQVTARAVRHGTKLALAATACWYIAWFALPIGVAAWAGLIVFVVATIVGFWFARTMMLRRVADEFRRRKELLSFRDKIHVQTNSTT